MEATREIYWNIGHGVVIPMYILAFAAFGVMAWGFLAAPADLAPGQSP